MAADTLIALTVFLVVKMNINLEINKNRFHEAYLAFAIGYPLLISLIPLLFLFLSFFLLFIFFYLNR